MEIVREKTACFTGHRPEKLPDMGADNFRRDRIIKSMLYKEIYDAVNRGFDTFIVGMQRGVDLWAGEMVLDMASVRPLHIIAALPYRDMGRNFKCGDKWTFGRIMSSADAVTVISERYTRSCMAERNRFMVDNSSLLIAAVADEKSGTGQTVRYAGKMGLEIRRIDLNSLFPDPDQTMLL